MTLSRVIAAVLWLVVVLRVMRGPASAAITYIPALDVFACSANGTGGVVNIVSGDLTLGIPQVAVAAIAAYDLWQWWRRRRQGKPSRVAAVVRDLGHRLTVVPVGAR